MARGNDSKTSEADAKQEEADRYRKAAEDALQQLDWAIGYLHGIRKVRSRGPWRKTARTSGRS